MPPPKIEKNKTSYWIDFNPARIRVLCDEPMTISGIAQEAGIDLRAECNGKGTCGKCLVKLTGEDIPPPHEVEKKHLDDSQLSQGFRLACKTMAGSNMEVFVPPESLLQTQVMALYGSDAGHIARSAAKLVFVEMPVPSLKDQRHDLERVSDALREQPGLDGAQAGLPALRILRHAVRAGNWQAWIGLRGNEIIGTYDRRPPFSVGLAVDVGTTKLVCYLVDLETGQCLAAKGAMNPQIAFGEDLMSRLEAVMTDPATRVTMQRAVVDRINQIAAELCASHELKTDQILDLCMVGNPAMHHLLLNLPVRPLALSPFVAALGTPLNTHAAQLRLNAAPGAVVHLPPPVAGFVGSDHLAFLLATGFGEDERIRLGIDIGTNTEIALQARGRILCCSAASGPAFEGGQIRYGMRAAAGAIEAVTINPQGLVCLAVIGDHPPVGICGSGVLDTLAELRRTNTVNKRGRLNENMPGVYRKDESTLKFVLAPASGQSKEICFTQQDIDQVLLAKGAIRAGIDILMAEMGITPADLDEIVMAGAFGSFLNPEKAMGISMLPEVLLKCVSTVGNAAGTGVRMMLSSQDARKQAMGLAERIEHQELATHPVFHKYLAKAMRLPGE